MRILIVEEERHISTAIERELSMEGYDVDYALDGMDGIWRAREGAYAAIVLNFYLPKMNGIEVCHTLRQESIDTPILMLTSRIGEFDEVRCLDAGADDFLRKPFANIVFIARIRALMRRGRACQTYELTYGAVRYNPLNRECFIHDQHTTFTRREGAVLEVLLRAKGEVVTKQKLIFQVWGMDFDGDPNILDVYIGYIRRKLMRLHSQSPISNVHGTGYRLMCDEAWKNRSVY